MTKDLTDLKARWWQSLCCEVQSKCRAKEHEWVLGTSMSQPSSMNRSTWPMTTRSMVETTKIACTSRCWMWAFFTSWHMPLCTALSLSLNRYSRIPHIWSKPNGGVLWRLLTLCQSISRCCLVISDIRFVKLMNMLNVWHSRMYVCRN